MARFDVFKNEGGTGYLLDVQSDLLSGLNTRAVAQTHRADPCPMAESCI